MKTAAGRREPVLNALHEGYHLAEKTRNGPWPSSVEITYCDGETSLVPYIIHDTIGDRAAAVIGVTESD